MNKASVFERLYVSLTDSKTFRGLAQRGLGQKMLRSQAYNQVRMFKNRLSTAVAVKTHPHLFDDLQTFCLFIGHNKSGTSMLGALLDAHPEIILADEVGALQYLLYGFGREQVFHLLLKSSRRERIKGRVTARRLKPYSYKVPGQFQGSYLRLRVIGDGKAGSTTELLSQNPEVLERLSAVMNGLNLRFIQSVRNPFDPISAMMVRGKRSFDNSIADYFSKCDMLVRLRGQIGVENLLAIRYEDFIRQPEAHLNKLTSFLGVDAAPEYVNACKDILRSKPDEIRGMVAWTPEWIQVVETQIQKYDFLKGYRFRS